MVQNHGADARAQGPIRHILVLKYEVLVQCMRHDDLCVMYLGWNWVTHNGRRAILEAGEEQPKASQRMLTGRTSKCHAYQCQRKISPSTWDARCLQNQ